MGYCCLLVQGLAATLTSDTLVSWIGVPIGILLDACAYLAGQLIIELGQPMKALPVLVFYQYLAQVTRYLHENCTFVDQQVRVFC